MFYALNALYKKGRTLVLDTDDFIIEELSWEDIPSFIKSGNKFENVNLGLIESDVYYRIVPYLNKVRNGLPNGVSKMQTNTIIYSEFDSYLKSKTYLEFNNILIHYNYIKFTGAVLNIVYDNKLFTFYVLDAGLYINTPKGDNIKIIKDGLLVTDSIGIYRGNLIVSFSILNQRKGKLKNITFAIKSGGIYLSDERLSDGKQCSITQYKRMELMK